MAADENLDTPVSTATVRSELPLPLRWLASLKWAAETLNAFVQMAAIVAAGIWAFYTFIYEDRIKPASEPPVFTIVNRLERVGRRGNLIAIHAETTLQNIGKTRVRFLARAHNAVGIRVYPDQSQETQIDSRTTGKRIKVYKSRHFATSVTEVVMSDGELLRGAARAPDAPAASFLEPGERMIEDKLFYIDRTRFDQVLYSVEYAYAREGGGPFPVELRTDKTGSLVVRISEPCRQERVNCPSNSDNSFLLSLW